MARPAESVANRTGIVERCPSCRSTPSLNVANHAALTSFTCVWLSPLQQWRADLDEGRYIAALSSAAAWARVMASGVLSGFSSILTMGRRVSRPTSRARRTSVSSSRRAPAASPSP